MIETLQSIIREQVAGVASVDPEVAALVADESVTKFFEQFGGSMHYLPVGRVFRSSKLHRAIWDAYTGANYSELQKKFGLSLPHVYVIVKRERARDKKNRQAGLPGLESS